MGAWIADAVSALPFTTEFQVKPGRTGVIARGGLDLKYLLGNGHWRVRHNKM